VLWTASVEAPSERLAEARALEAGWRDKLGDLSGATVAYQVKQLTQRLIEAFEPLFVDAMPGIVHGHLLGVQEESAYIAADRSAGKLRHPLIVTRPAWKSQPTSRISEPLINSGSAGSLRDHRRLALGLSMLILCEPAISIRVCSVAAGYRASAPQRVRA
jgi:hypothetical protein